MARLPTRPLRPWRWFWTATAGGLAGGLVLPAAAYLAGQRFIGAYEGSRGVAGYVGSLWQGVLAAEPLAWAVLLAPGGLGACWLAVARGLRRTR